jgi:ketosteroid isomerase-like protein
MVHFPWAWRAAIAVGLRVVGPSSRVRRGFLRRETLSAYAAASRRDYELMLVRYAPDAEFRFDPELAMLGLGGTYRGHDGILRLINAFDEAWDNIRFEPSMMVDMGDLILGLGRVRLKGTASGLESEREFAQVLRFKRGGVAHEQEFLSWEKGLQAAGIDPAELKPA